ncbi:MAG: amidohydrolase family protein [Steroidobacteraceae bacterium]|jgi:5-methylthioadenosine/S-adenosylhomocysteine deaminase|nr:amidohydrolase family protein [Steroidobacteraceae bacterium]
MLDRRRFVAGAAAGFAAGALGEVVAAPGAAAPVAVERGATARELLLTDAIVLTMDGTRRAFRSGYVWIRGERIHRVGPTRELGEPPRGVPRRRLDGRLVMPGLVNCHTHLSNGMLRGLYDEMPLEVWFAQGMWPVLDGLDAAAAERGADLALLELLSTGVTTTASGEIAGRHPTMLDGVLTAVERAGIRAVVSRIAMDSADESSPAQFIPRGYRDTPQFAADEVRRLRRRYDSARVSVVPEALGVLRCTPEMVQAMHAVAREVDGLFTMHAASSQDERDASRRRFGHGSIVELERLGVLGPKTLLAHAIWLDDAEIRLVAQRGTGLSHNPVSNAYYASGVARLPELLAAGARVGLGVDGASTNNGQNVWETMKMAMLFQKQRLEKASFGSAELALELMTRGGAAALHMEDRIGSLEPGKLADLIVIDTERVALAPSQTIVSNLVYSNDPWAVQDVYVGGERVIEGGRHPRLDAKAVVAGARTAFGRVLRTAGLEEYVRTRGGWQWQ